MGERAERPAEPVRVTDVEALMADDGETFAVLFDRYWIDVVRFVSRRAPHDHAVDVASEVFRIAFVRRLDFVPRHDTARPWLYGIASNLLRSQRRSESRGRRAVLRLAGRAVAARSEHIGISDLFHPASSCGANRDERPIVDCQTINLTGFDL